MELFGLEIATADGVYEPREDTLLAAEQLGEILKENKKAGLVVLDMGCGTGILGLLAATYDNVTEVTLCDVNKAAVELAEKNYGINKSKIKARCSFVLTDLFASIAPDRKFDLLIFNTPYLPEENLESKLSIDETAWSGGKDGISVADTFIRQSVSHATGNCTLLLISSSFADLRQLRRRADSLGFEIVQERKKHFFFEDIISIWMRKRF